MVKKLTYLSLSLCLLWAPAYAAKVPFRLKPQEPTYLDCNAAYQQKAYDQAISLCQKDADGGDLNAHTLLGLMYYRGLGFLQDARKANEHFQFAAQRGNEVAQFHLAKLILMKTPTASDEQFAFHWLEKAAYQQYAPAEFLVAICYRNGIGTHVNLNQSAYWYEQAKAHGIGTVVAAKPDPMSLKINTAIHDDTDPHVTYLRGKNYLSGNGVSQNDAMALHYFEQAAQKNHPEAQGHLAWMLALGLGGEANLPQAVYWFNAGNPITQASEKLDTIAINLPEKNSHLLRYSANTPEKQLALGREMIETSTHEKDRQSGIHLIELAAYHNNADAQLYLSTLYHEGRYVNQDLSLAFQYAEKAAAAGHPDAQYALGWHYAHGIGTQKNLTKAYSWFDKSGRKGNPRAHMAQDFIADQINLNNKASS